MSYSAELDIINVTDPAQFKALAGGKVWFGVPDGSPATVAGDRIQVYLARQGLADLAIAQPLDIGPGGQVMYSGQPAQIKVLVPYCVQVMNSLGVQKYYAPKSNGVIDKLIQLEQQIASQMATVDTFTDLSSTDGTIGDVVFVPENGHFLRTSQSGLTEDSGTVAFQGGEAWKRIEYTINSEIFSDIDDMEAAREDLSGYTDMKVKADFDTVPTLLGTNLNHLRAQKPAFYSLPRFFRDIQSYRHDLQPAINIVGFGSSVGNGASLPDPATQKPISVFFSTLKSAFDPGNLYNLVEFNDCVNGSTISESLTALADAVTAGHTPTICVLAYGMNDGGVAIYNAGQTYPAVYSSALRFVYDARALGADVVLMTSPHHKTSAVTYEMPVGIDQVYPTTILSPVSPAQIQPPAAQSNISADFTGSGTNITVSHRHLRVNQAIRQAATDACVPLIDVERYWFKAVEKFGESALFDVGEVLHPNLLGHQNSYWLAINEFLESMSWQTAQEGQEPRLNGAVGVNSELPTAIFDVDIPYPESSKDAMHVKARLGVVDGNGVKASAKVLAVETTTGDIVTFGVKTTDSTTIESGRLHTRIDGTGTLVSAVEWTREVVGTLVHTDTISGGYNLTGVVTIATVVNGSCGSIEVNAFQNAIGIERITCDWVATGGAITFGTPVVVGSAVLTGPTSSGLDIRVTTVSPNTNISWKIKTNSGL